MTNKEFIELQVKLQEAMNTVEILQQIYIKETNRRYIHGQGIQKQQLNKEDYDG